MDLNTVKVNYHAMLQQSPDPIVVLDFDRGVVVDVNPAAQALWGRPRAQLVGMMLDQLCPPLQPDGTRSPELLRRHAQRSLAGAPTQFEATFQHAGGGQTRCEAVMVPVPLPGHHLFHARVVDITRRILATRLIEGQAEVLELIARAAPLKDILERLTLLIEEQSPGVLCTVLLLDDDGMSIHSAAGPSMPAQYMRSLEGLHIGPRAGSCGDAMFENRTVIVPDILADPRWQDYVSLAAPYGLRACWSTPIAPDGAQVLGSFAMYYREVRSPAAGDIELARVATHLAGIAIQCARRAHELELHRAHLEDLVAARTGELSAAVARADQVNQELSNALNTLSLAQDELVRRDKLAALGALVAGVAHELNTPIGNSLVVATSFADRTRALQGTVAGGLRRSDLERYLADAAEAGELLVRNLKRAATLVAGFKQIAVDQASAEQRQFSLSELLCDLAAPLRVAAKGARVSIELAVDPELSMNSYPGPLSQVVTELFENCLAHAFPAGGGGVRIGAARRGADLVAITVTDDGAGMAPEVQAHVYDPFFTTRLGTGRSGLGLHVAHNIVSNILGGRIELRSAPGEGATFTLLLPVTAPERPAPAPVPPPA